ncbi:MAG: peptidoglycan bridge formation glycyltransferase FemA/FemB family protein [bacterium]|nr:peptidoglycan bridge formation glycyltransferase FemA/FemB family protein [bacterium]MDN5835496.1 peptidoglycan bridge formation glycyltransferase FemA/FemB family protein [bacterium]
MIDIQVCEDKSTWNNLVHDRGGHPLQLWGWGDLKAAHNWQAVRLIARDGAEIVGYCQVLLRKLPRPFKMFAYSPRVRVGETNSPAALDKMVKYIKANYPVTYFSIDPDQEQIKLSSKWRKTANTILIPKTLILDLSKSDSDLLADMSKKTRQYVRKSAKEAVEVRRLLTDVELDECLDIYKQTASRAGFALHDDQYYYDVHSFMGERSHIYGAFSREKLVAFVWLAVSDETAFELYGGMNDEGQKLRSNYNLKWQAITEMKQTGIRRYDMNGLLNDGVSTFKRGFATHENQLVGTYDYPLSPLYIVWSKVLPMGRTVLRKLKQRSVKNNS